MNKPLQKLILKNLLARKKVGKVGKAQIKITAITIHNIILGVVGLAAVTYFDANFYEEAINFVMCQSTGRESCEVQGISSLDEIIILAVVIIILAVLPIVAILFTCDPKACCKCKKEKPTTTTKRSTI